MMTGAVVTDSLPLTLLRAALELVAQGWAVFPCDWRPGDHEKAPLLPSPGYHLATTDPQQIRTWWRRWPKAMIGVRVPEAFLVLDIDPRNGGDLAELESLTGPLPATLIVWSGRNDGGRHLYFQRPAGELMGTRLKPLGIDLKVNGYVIAPPSIHPATGQPYRWEHHPVALLPHALRELLRPRARPIITNRGNSGNGAGLVRTVAQAQEGSRNDTLYWAACRAVEDGLINQLEDQLIAAAMTAGETETKARRTVASARKSGASNV
jgi:hypothetical protein